MGGGLEERKGKGQGEEGKEGKEKGRKTPLAQKQKKRAIHDPMLTVLFVSAECA
jgi:hypothetical protein